MSDTDWNEDGGAKPGGANLEPKSHRRVQKVGFDLGAKHRFIGKERLVGGS